MIWWYISGLLALPLLLCGYLLSFVGWAGDVARAMANRIRTGAPPMIGSCRARTLNAASQTATPSRILTRQP